ncbi:MAG: ISAs1 family transposase [Desulfobacterales bacterium]
MPAEGNEETKRTNEIKTAIPLLGNICIQGKTITTDALLAQRSIADYIIGQKGHYHFTIKGNQSGILQDVQLFFQDRKEPDFIETPSCEHGRIDTRKIWATSELNNYLNFPSIGQAFAIERESINKKSGKTLREIAYGIDSRTPEQATPQRLLSTNRGHWSIENCCHYILDWNFDEDRSRISKGHGPENIARLRRFAISIIKSKKGQNVAQTMRQLSRNTRLVFDYLRMTSNSCKNMKR